MALFVKHKETQFGVGDIIKVFQKIKEGEKFRLQAFEGMVIAIRGHGECKSFTVRRIGTQGIGIERIFPLMTPVIEKIEVVRKGVRGVRRAKLYYTREKSKKEIEKIYTRVHRREQAKKSSKEKTIKKPLKKTSRKKV